MIRLSEDHHQIREVVASFSDNELWPNSAAIDKDAVFPRAALDQLGELGVLGIPVPAEHGGADGDLLMLTLVLEELARGCAATSMVVASHAAASLAIRCLGSAEQQAQFLPKLASGELLATIAQVDEAVLTESAPVAPESPSRGSQPCMATSSESGWTIHGRKKFVVAGGDAGLFVVLARTAGSGDLGAFVVEANADGVSVSGVEDMLGLRGGRFAEIAFVSCQVPAACALGDVGADALKSVVAAGRISAAAVATGVARRAIDYARQYAGERRAFGKTIDRFEAIRTFFAEAATQTEAGALLAYRAATLWDQQQSFEAEASMAKLYATDAAYRTTKNCVQILGGNGFSREYPVERMYRDAETLEVLEAQSRLHRRLIADRLLGVAT